MSRLILTFEDIAGGALKGAGIADFVLPFGWRLVWGELPSPGELESEARTDGRSLIEFCARFDTVELWADAEPNAQLQLIWLLDHLRLNPDVVARLALVQTSDRIGSLGGEELARQCRQSVNGDHLDIASAAWAAWRAPTPVAWFDLMARDLSVLPQLRSSVIALLEELPMRVTGIGATESRMLELLAAGYVHPYDLFPGHEKPNERRSYGYWEVGELLDGLARCPHPAVSGLAEGPFDDALHDSSERHLRYRNSRLALTDLGHAILGQSDDFSRHNPIHRWWGGTELTSARLWRWDPIDRRLVAP